MRALSFRSRSRRRRSIGASGVEFALVAPVFFAGIFGTLDGGLLLYSANAVNHSVGIGMIVVAQGGTQGDLSTTDTDAVAAIKAQGFGASGFAKIDEVDIFMTHVDATTGAVTQDTNSCGGGACYDRYDANGNSIGARPWDPASRQTSLSSLTTLGITIKAHYNYLAFNASTVNVTLTRYFQMEPQS